MVAMTIDPRLIGQRIKAARDAKLWTQLQFAAEANVSPSSVARWESGKLPPVRELVRIADILDVEPEWLVEMPSLKDPGVTLSNERLDRLEAQGAENRSILAALARALGVPMPDDRVPDTDDERAA